MHDDVLTLKLLCNCIALSLLLLLLYFFSFFFLFSTIMANKGDHHQIIISIF